MRTNISLKGVSLAGVPEFAGLEPAVLERVADMCVGCRYPAGAVVMRHGDPGKELFFVLSGTVEATLWSVSGRRVSYFEKGPGELVGELAAMDGKPRCANVVAKTDCLLASLSATDFIELVNCHPSLAHKLLLRMAGQIRALSERLFDVSALLVRHRVHVELLRLAQKSPGTGNSREIRPAPRHAHIASRISSHREAVAREIALLLRQGMLRKARSGLIVTDLAGLEREVIANRGALPSPT